jgi:hypothetical protein
MVHTILSMFHSYPFSLKIFKQKIKAMKTKTDDHRLSKDATEELRQKILEIDENQKTISSLIIIQ